ncbi:hypothetical protein HDU76_011357, partial [Blyttiomyces sp. JEL0837]
PGNTHAGMVKKALVSGLQEVSVVGGDSISVPLLDQEDTLAASSVTSFPTCRKCFLPKPDRAHHCIYLYDVPIPNLVSRQSLLFLFVFLVDTSVCISVGAIAIWNFYMLSTAQTTVEYYQNRYAAAIARSRGDTFTNEFDIGTKRNIMIHFNISKSHPWWTVLVPYRVPPVGDGTQYPKVSTMFSRTESESEFGAVLKDF